MVTANRTRDGAVVYRTATQDWSTNIIDAAVVRTVEDARALLAEAAADGVVAIGSYIAPVEIAIDGVIKPGNLRERIRAEGVTFPLRLSA